MKASGINPGQTVKGLADVLGDGVAQVVVAGDFERAVIELFGAAVHSMSGQQHDKSNPENQTRHHPEREKEICVVSLFAFKKSLH